MTALGDAFDRLLDAARATPPRAAHVDHATLALLQLASAEPDARRAIVDRAAEVVRAEPIAVAAPVAMAAGVLIEHGAPAGALPDALGIRLSEVLGLAADFARAVIALGATGAGEEAPGIWVGDSFAPEPWVEERAATHPDEVTAWLELRRFCLPTIAAATHDRVALTRLVHARFGADLDLLRRVEPHCRFLHILHRVLLDAPLRFVHAPTGRVFDLRVDAVATNFELHTLLAHALAEPLGMDPPDPEIVACLQGRGPRQLLKPSHSAWALYAPAAYADLLAGRKVPHERWVWNESIPAEIPQVDGARVLVAGDQSFARDWETGRTFAALGGRVEVVAELDEAAAAAFRERLAAP